MVKKSEQKEYVLAIAAIVAIVLIVVLVQKVPFQKNLAGQGFLSATSFTVPVDLDKLSPTNIEFGQWYKVQVSGNKLLVEKVTAKKELAQILQQTATLTPVQTEILAQASLEPNVVYLVKSDGQNLRVYSSLESSKNDLTGQVAAGSLRKKRCPQLCCHEDRYGDCDRWSECYGGC